MQDKLNFLNIIAYAFLHVQQNGEVQFNDSHIDLSQTDNTFCMKHKSICIDKNGKYKPKLGNFSAFTHLQNKQGDLKKLISIGGGNDHTSFEYAISHVQPFVASTSALIKEYHLDGVDLDFEPTTFTPEKITVYIQLIQQLREALGPKAIISVTLMLQSIMQQKAWNKAASFANFIIPMCYNLESPVHAKYTSYNSFYKDPDKPHIHQYSSINCNQAINKLILLGIPREKIIIGYPSYAIVYSGVSPNNYGLHQSFNKTNSLSSTYKRIDNESIEYRTVIQLLKHGFQEHIKYVNGHINGVWAYNPKDQLLIMYENPKSIKEKSVYVKKNNLAGLMTWLIGYDMPFNDESSLLRAAYFNLNED